MNTRATAPYDELTQCASSPLTVTLADTDATSSTATITGLTAAEASACQVATLRLATTSGTTPTPITLTPATSMTATVPALAATVAAALVDADGWALTTHLQVEDPEPTLGCEILQDGTPTGVTCTVTATVTGGWGESPSRFATVHIAISPAPTYQQVARLTVDLPPAFEASGLGSNVADWNWAASAISANYPFDAGTVTCSLPVFTALTYTGAASGDIQVNENGTASPGTC